MSPAVDRRSLLSIGASGLLAAFAGCTQLNRTREQIPVQVRNETGSAHDFLVRVRYMDEAVLNASTSVGAGESTSYRFENPAEHETVTVLARVDGSEEVTERVDIGPGTGTEFISVVLDESDGLQILVAIE